MLNDAEGTYLDVSSPVAKHALYCYAIFMPHFISLFVLTGIVFDFPSKIPVSP